MMSLFAVLLEDPVGTETSSAIVKVKHMYQSCLNTSAYTVQGGPQSDKSERIFCL